MDREKKVKEEKSGEKEAHTNYLQSTPNPSLTSPRVSE